MVYTNQELKHLKTKQFVLNWNRTKALLNRLEKAEKLVDFLYCLYPDIVKTKLWVKWLRSQGDDLE